MAEETLTLVKARLATLGLSAATCRALVVVFLEQAPSYVSALESAADARDARALRRALHALRGSAANLGLTPAVTQCDLVRQAVRRAQDRVDDEGLARLRELVEITNAARAVLDEWTRA